MLEKNSKLNQASLAETTLDNGVKIYCFNKQEVETLYGQIKYYFRHGIEVQEGDTVFDVGANIGLFTVYTFMECRQNVDIYAFEPIPAIFNVLEANAQLLNSEKIKVFACGLSQKARRTIFAWFPNASMLSTQYTSDLADLRRTIKESLARNITKAPWTVRWMVILPYFMRDFLIDKKLDKYFTTQEVVCELRTISEIITEHNINHIDLLKIDVEKGELDVLLGINERDWSKIKQVVIEIHDVENRVDKIKEVLSVQGFKQIYIEQEPVLRGSDVFNLYALR